MVEFVMGLWLCVSAAPNDPHFARLLGNDVQGHVFASTIKAEAEEVSLDKCLAAGHGRLCWTTCVQIPNRALANE